MSSFNFSFAGDDIDCMDEDDLSPHITSLPSPLSPVTQTSFRFHGQPSPQHLTPTALIPHLPGLQAAETGSLRRGVSSAFPIPGQTYLPAQLHSLDILLSSLPSKISYSSLTIELDDGSSVTLPRRELWDVRVQLMAEDEGEGNGMEGLGKDDVKTGVYEGGFKSWESSVDVVKELAKLTAGNGHAWETVLEMGCGTALPSLAMLQWQLSNRNDAPLHLILADYNPSVLRLVTLPNVLLVWAKCRGSVMALDESSMDADRRWDVDGELDIDAAMLQAFRRDLESYNITLSFLSGAWGPEFVQFFSQACDAYHSNIQQLQQNSDGRSGSLLVLGAETIYSPAALKSFAETLMAVLARRKASSAAIVGAKKVYFGVGGSMEDFCQTCTSLGGVVRGLREETEGIRRGVVEVKVNS